MASLVRNAPDLTSLHLNGSLWLTDVGLTHVRAIKRLRCLRLPGCYTLSNDALCDLGACRSVQHLDLRFTRFEAKGPQRSACLRDLRTLLLSTEMDSESFNLVLDNFRRLEVLHVVDCSALTDTDGAKFRLLTCLKELEFDNGVGFTDLTFAQGLGSPAMEKLAIRGSQLTDAGLASIAVHHKHLSALRLRGGHSVADNGLRAFFLQQPFLCVLSLETDAIAEWSKRRALCARLRSHS